jgi:hypothetical protein
MEASLSGLEPFRAQKRRQQVNEQQEGHEGGENNHDFSLDALTGGHEGE